jgi:hypothetical protein
MVFWICTEKSFTRAQQGFRSGEWVSPRTGLHPAGEVEGFVSVLEDTGHTPVD